MNILFKIVLLSSFIFGSQAFAICLVQEGFSVMEASPTCDEAERDIIKRFEAAKQLVGSDLFPSCIAEIHTYAKKCNMDLNRMHLNAPIMVLEKKDSGVRFQKTKKKMESSVKYGELSEHDYEKYKLYASKSGVSAEAIEKAISDFKMKNVLNNDREKKQCTPIDLRENNKVLSEVRNQDSVGWCYAFTAADLIGSKLGKKVSAADVAMTYNADSFLNGLSKKYLNSSETEFRGGWSKDAIENLKNKGGVCLEENLNSEDNGYGELGSNLREIEAYKNKASISCPRSASVVFPQLQYEDFAAISKKVNRENLLEALSDKACGPRIDIADFKVQENIYTRGFGDCSILDQQLEKKTPVGVYYHLQDITGLSGAHASVVAGRRYNEKTNSCEYLVKNSWGSSCSYYLTSIDCSKGFFWASKAVLSNAIYGTVYVE